MTIRLFFLLLPKCFFLFNWRHSTFIINQTKPSNKHKSDKKYYRRRKRDLIKINEILPLTFALFWASPEAFLPYLCTYHFPEHLVPCNALDCWFLNFLVAHTLRHFTWWHFIQHPYWSKPFIGNHLWDLDNQLFFFFQGQWLFPQANSEILSMLCPHSHAREISQKATHPIIIPWQTCLTKELLSDDLSKSICILLV